MMGVGLIVVAAGWTTIAAGAPESCHAAVDLARLDEALGRAEAAMSTLDQEELEDAARAAREAAGCVDALLSAERIARLHRVTGIASFTAGDAAAAWDAFTVARALDPTFELDAGLGPPLRKLYAAVPTNSDRAPLVAPTEGWGVVDGGPATDAPTGRPYFVQWFHTNGTVRSNAFVPTGQPPPFSDFVPPTRERVAGRGGQLAATGALFLGIGVGAVAVGPVSPDRGIGDVAQIGGAVFCTTGAFLLGLAAAR